MKEIFDCRLPIADFGRVTNFNASMIFAEVFVGGN